MTAVVHFNGVVSKSASESKSCFSSFEVAKQVKAMKKAQYVVNSSIYLLGCRYTEAMRRNTRVYTVFNLKYQR